MCTKSPLKRGLFACARDMDDAVAIKGKSGPQPDKINGSAHGFSIFLEGDMPFKLFTQLYLYIRLSRVYNRIKRLQDAQYTEQLSCAPAG
jgi:hypothetical protein